ncbi:MAG: FkbM family methyltransferase, partial [Gemmatimonas sp.]|nr:FkbM family methyltransferase [Gemmatimonas sp.]
MKSSPRGALTAQLLHAMAAYTPWVEDGVRGLRQVVSPGDVVVDVGAGLGVYTSALSHLVGPTGVV